jgi:hypothetical protein
MEFAGLCALGRALNSVAHYRNKGGENLLIASDEEGVGFGV